MGILRVGIFWVGVSLIPTITQTYKKKVIVLLIVGYVDKFLVAHEVF